MKLPVLLLVPLVLAGCVPENAPPAGPRGMPLDPELKPTPAGNAAITQSDILHETSVTIP